MQGVTEVTALLLQLQPGTGEEAARLYAEAAVGEILSYCGIEVLPRELYLAAARRAVELQLLGDGVKSVSRGDYAVTYGDDPGSSLKKLLQPYRKVRW